MIKIDFKDFFKTLIDTIKSHDFFVDWNKADENTRKIEKRLSILNYLFRVSKNEFKNEFFKLLNEYPEIIEAFPILLATREKEQTVINKENFEIIKYSFEKSFIITKELQEKYYIFFKETGLEEMISSKKVKDLIDYVFGVEVGMDTNARKNRTGTSMEKIVEGYIKKFCDDNKNLDFITQASQSKIFEKWKYKFDIDKTDRRFDFAIYNNFNNQIFFVEVNFYGSQGSKLKATAGEYQYLENFLIKQNINLIWITDGLGWNSAKNALEETYNNNRYVINLFMLKNGILKEIING